MKRNRLPVLLAVIPVLCPLCATAAEPADREKIFTAPRIETPPVIDGRLDEAVWQQAVVIDDIHQIRPHEYAAPTERTLFYVMYDKDNLYVGARSWYSEPEKMTAHILRQGAELLTEDRIAVILDPFNDKRSGYMFELNPNGVRLDGLFNTPTQFAPWWDGIWQGQSAITGDGYTAEFAIPFKTLSFDPEDEAWGFNVWRSVMHKDEQMGWVSHNRSTNPAAAGEIRGLRDLDIGRGLDIVPSASVRRERDFGRNDTDLRLEPSLDVFYRITPSLNSVLTFNTDFSATEIDDRQVNLDRFNLFFPEKRDFFLKDSDIFDFGNTGNEQPFFSRRIGLSAGGEPVDLDYGGKISGRVGEWNLGALAIRQAGFEDIAAETLMVARVTRNVLEESSLGAIITHGDPTSNLDNALAGVDFRYLNTSLSEGRTLTGELWYLFTNTDGLHDDNAAWGAGLAMPNQNQWNGRIAVREYQRNFNPALGFITRRGVRDHNAEIAYIHRPGRGWLRDVTAGVNYRYVMRLADDKLQTQTVMFRLLELANYQGDRLMFRYFMGKEGLEYPFEISRGVILPRGLYAFDRYGVQYETSPARKVSVFGDYWRGNFYNGKRIGVEFGFLWRPNEHLNFSGAYDFNDIELVQGKFITRLMSFKSDIVFSNTLAWTNLIQFDNVSNNLGFNSRLHWVPQAGRNVYLVYNHNLIDTEDGFVSTRSDITLKANYTFRF
jgi:hypothetical protein